MYSLRRFHGARFERINAIIDSLAGHLTSFVNLIGSATLPLPEVCAMEGLPGTACRVEGHRGGRYFPATDPIDLAEDLIEERVRLLFGLDTSYRVSGQPHSATQANQIVLRAVLDDSRGGIAALSPSDGGHVSHRVAANTASAFLPFPLCEDGIDYDALDQAVRRFRPRILIAGGTSYTRSIDYERLRRVADVAGSHLHADLAHMAPFVAAGQHAPAFPYVDSATLDGSKNLRGPRGGILIFRRDVSRSMERAIFPLLQSSPNQCGLMAKAACLAHWSPDELLGYCDRMVSAAESLAERLEPLLGRPVFGGTDSHLLLFDLSSIAMDGGAAEARLEEMRVLANRNQVPGDTRPAMSPSGIRFGTTVLAILHYAADDVRDLGDAIVSVLDGSGSGPDTIARLLDRYHRPLASSASEWREEEVAFGPRPDPRAERSEP